MSDTPKKSSNRRGPLYVNPDDMDPNYKYRFINMDEEHPYKIEEKLDRGWTLVTSDEMSHLKTRLPDLLRGSSTVGSYICQTVGPNTKAYLCKISRELYEENFTSSQQLVDDLDSALRNKGKEEGFYGDINIERTSHNR